MRAGVSPREEECPICFAAVGGDVAVLRPCGHAFCSACVRRALRRQPTCPLCRRAPIALEDEVATTRRVDQLLICALGERHPHGGITVGDAHAGGVRVIRVDPRDAAYAGGLRRSDILREINGVPCVTHQQVVKQWDEASRAALETGQEVILSCDVAPRRAVRGPRRWRVVRLLLEAGRAA